MISEESLIPWKCAILRKTDKIISKLKNRIKPSKSNPILKQIYAISCLEALQKTFVLVPIDKACKKVAIICKWYYVEVILNEMCLIGHGNNTYCKANKSCYEIIDESTEYTKRLDFKITVKEKTLSTIYWSPIMHKNKQVHVSSLHLKYALQNKFLNLPPITLSS